MIKKIFKIIDLKKALSVLPYAFTGMLFAGSLDIVSWIWVALGVISAKSANDIFKQAAVTDTAASKNKFTTLPVSKEKLRLLLAGLSLCGLFILASYFLNELCFYLTLLSVIFLISYPLLKPETSVHYYNSGIIEGLSPVGGYIAVTGRFDLIPVILGAAFLAWIAGLDILDKIGHSDFTRNKTGFSIPARFGLKKALFISLIFYMFSITALLTAGILSEKNLPYWTSLICIAVIFFRQQVLIRGKEIEIGMIEILQINNFISLILFAGTFIDVLYK